MGQKLVAVVVTHNRQSQLKATLERLLEAEAALLTNIVVYDNASDDGTAGYLASLGDCRLHLVRSTENLGGAGGFEAAMRIAVEHFDPDWIVLMDDDARPHVDTIAKFHDQPRYNYDAWAAAVYYPDGTICDMNRPWINPFRSLVGFVVTLLKGRNGFHMGPKDYEGKEVRQIDGGSFVGLFLSRAAVAAAGFPDGRLFLYGDDVLYTLGLSQSGAKLAFDPGLTFEHDCPTLVAGSLMRPIWKVYYFHRNQVIVYRRAAGLLLFWPVLAGRAALWWSRAPAYGRDGRTYRRLLTHAIRDGLRQRTSRDHAEVLALSADPE